MGKFKHNKLRNTAILFEILCKNLVHETLNPAGKQSAVKIIKKYFNKDSSLLYELRMYQQLCEVGVSVSPAELIDVVIQSRNKVDTKKLDKEKYNLIKQIKETYNLPEFFSNRVSNYKLLASIFNIFEHAPSVNPTSYLTNKKTIVESLSTKIEELPVDQELKHLMQEDKQVRNIALKTMVKKFNDKYKGLNERQRILVKRYINENTETAEFKDFIITECKFISKELNNKIQQLDESVTKIKLTEVNNLLQTIITAPIIKDEHLSSMLKYHELLGEI